MSLNPRLIFLTILMLMLVACTQAEQEQPPVSEPEVISEPEIASAPTIEVEKQPSMLVFEPPLVDMGTVKEGEELVAYLRVRNAGDTMQQIVDVQASCGCSLVEPEERLLMPGSFTRIKVTIDTFAKLDDVKKWVQLTDAEGRSNKAILRFTVRPNPHMGDSSRSIFDGKCAACHFDTAKGKQSGPEIYTAVCGMCHGAGAVGAVAPALIHHKNAEALAALISSGTGSQHMPGFAKNMGGPLTEKQISALSKWLSRLDE